MGRQTTELSAQGAEDNNDLAHKLALSGPNTRWLKPLAGGSGEPPVALLGPVHNGPVVYDPAFTSHEGSGSREYATPGSRAVGQLIRLLPFSLGWGLLTWGLVWVLGLDTPFFLLGFALLTSATYWRMNKDEFDFSRNGLERHKVDSALEVRLTELQNSHELRKMALEGYLRHLEGGNGQ
ncbi:MAG: hypothetical protein KF753_18335 [Caldilineaceae bacterium]|nr:hypothetical protein [Caldilineaceae bacterium]